MCSLREQLVADSEYFKRLLSLIPGGYCVNNGDNSASEEHYDKAAGGPLHLYCCQVIANYSTL